MQDGPSDGPGDAPDHLPGDAVDAVPSEPTPFEPTGHDEVDRVLAAMSDIEQRDVHEHVAVFEEAHGALRRALDRPDP